MEQNFKNFKISYFSHQAFDLDKQGISYRF